MAKRKMVQSNLLKNSVAAYFAAIEIYNKPNITYRYETVTLLIMNAWELVLKSYIRKYVKHKSIEYSGAAKPPVRSVGNHLSGLMETTCGHVWQSRQHSPEGPCQQ